MTNEKLKRLRRSDKTGKDEYIKIFMEKTKLRVARDAPRSSKKTDEEAEKRQIDFYTKVLLGKSNQKRKTIEAELAAIQGETNLENKKERLLSLYTKFFGNEEASRSAFIAYGDDGAFRLLKNAWGDRAAFGITVKVFVNDEASKLENLRTDHAKSFKRLTKDLPAENAVDIVSTVLGHARAFNAAVNVLGDNLALEAAVGEFGMDYARRLARAVIGPARAKEAEAAYPLKELVT